MAILTKIDERLRRVHSGQNARVKELRRAFGEAAPNAEGEIAVEGMHLVEEAMAAAAKPRLVTSSPVERWW